MDSIYPRVRTGGKGVPLPVLVALDVKATRKKILLSLAIAGAETRVAWHGVLEDLAARHLERLRLIMRKGNAGPRSAPGRI